LTNKNHLRISAPTSRYGHTTTEEFRLSKKTFVPAFTPRSLKYTIEKKSSHLWDVIIEVPASLVAHVKDHITLIYQQYTIMPGLSCKNLPVSYTQHYFAQEIERETQRFLQDHFIQESVQDFLKEHKIATVNWPRLKEITVTASGSYLFTLSLSLAPAISLDNWQAYTFMAPKRKNYTDLDIQVESFLATLSTETVQANTIEPGDWVRFSAQFRSPHIQTPIHSPLHYWIRITNPLLASPAMQQFINAKINDTFILPATALAHPPIATSETNYYFDVTIENIVKTNKISLPQLQASLNVTDHQSLHNKLIELFSYRNDISLRKSIIEELFYSLLNVFRFEMAPHAITRRKEFLLFLMQKTPDNSVYIKQKQFANQITLLAEAKLKEEALIDAIAQYEQISVTPADITHYLSLASNERLKEFLYFSPLNEEALSSEQPCGEYILTQSVLREKTLNRIIEKLSL